MRLEADDNPGTAPSDPEGLAASGGFEDLEALRRALTEGGDADRLLEHYAVVLEVSRTLSRNLSLETLLPIWST